MKPSLAVSTDQLQLSEDLQGRINFTLELVKPVSLLARKRTHDRRADSNSAQ